jgi:3-hydroxybutyryl-CoA dehydrogenase
MSLELSHAPLLVVGAGIMGAGIAQVAAQAGHEVFLYDVREGAAAAAAQAKAVGHARCDPGRQGQAHGQRGLPP